MVRAVGYGEWFCSNKWATFPFLKDQPESFSAWSLKNLFVTAGKLSLNAFGKFDSS
jgi:hypothetical protein